MQRSEWRSSDKAYMVKIALIKIGVEIIKGTDPGTLASSCDRMSLLMVEIDDLGAMCGLVLYIHWTRVSNG